MLAYLQKVSVVFQRGFQSRHQSAKSLLEGVAVRRAVVRAVVATAAEMAAEVRAEAARVVMVRAEEAMVVEAMEVVTEPEGMVEARAAVATAVLGSVAKVMAPRAVAVALSSRTA